MEAKQLLQKINLEQNSGFFSGRRDCIMRVNFHIQSEYRKIRTRKNLYLDTFHAVQVREISNHRLVYREVVKALDLSLNWISMRK